MLSKGGNKHMRTLNNTEWGGGGAGARSKVKKLSKIIDFDQRYSYPMKYNSPHVP